MTPPPRSPPPPTLVNTAAEPDTLTHGRGPRGFYSRHGYTGRRERDLPSWRRCALRPALRELLTADRDTAVAWSTDARARPVRSPSWSGTTAGTGTSTWSARATARDPDHRRDRDGGHRPAAGRGAVPARRVCAGDGCQGVVVDLSRNRSRRFCSTACGNRAAVAAYRARRAAPTRPQRLTCDPALTPSIGPNGHGFGSKPCGL